MFLTYRAEPRFLPFPSARAPAPLALGRSFLGRQTRIDRRKKMPRDTKEKTGRAGARCSTKLDRRTAVSRRKTFQSQRIEFSSPTVCRALGALVD